MRMPLIKAMNLVTRREAGAEARGPFRLRGAISFSSPGAGRALFGTWESSRATSSDDVGVRDAEVDAFIADLNLAFPALDLKPDDVSLVHRGVVPGAAGPHGSVTLEGHEQFRDHGRADAGDAASVRVEGLITIAGTKYTTARAVAERVTTAVVAKLGREFQVCRTATTALPGGDLGDVALAIARARREHDAVLPSDTIPHLVAAYGSRFPHVIEIAADRPDWRTRIADTSPVIGAEIIWAVRHEMAVTLSDAVIRRTPLGALGFPGDAAAEQAAAIMAGELGWSDDRTRAEVAALRAFYAPG